MRSILILLPLMLAGCAKPGEKACEDYILGKLNAPATFKKVSVLSFPSDGKHLVRIEYDASNAYGVPIRDTQFCEFPIKNGSPDTSTYIDFDQSVLDEAAAKIEQAD